MLEKIDLAIEKDREEKEEKEIEGKRSCKRERKTTVGEKR